VLSQGVIVREGARVDRSVIDVGTYIGRSAVIEGAILGRGCDVRDHVRVHEGVAIGDQVTIGAEASLFPGVRVYPFKEIETGAQIHESIVWETRTASTPFGRDGATGLVNVDLTPETAVRLAAALGTALRRGDRVVASRATADACRLIQRAIIAGLTSTGVHVADLRISPAAVTRHVLKTQGMQAGVHVGRSSSDPEMIQVRVFEWPGNQMTSGLQKEVEKHFTRQELRRATFAEVGETAYPARVRESYAQDILDVLDMAAIKRRGFRIAVDYGHSPAAFTLPLVLGPLGVEAIGARGSLGEDSIGELAPLDAQRIVTGVRAHVGFVLDQAAERLLLIDERGEAVPADLGLLLVVRLLVLAGRQGRIAVPVTALCKVLELLAGQERPVSELVAELPRPTLTHRALPCPWSRKGLVMRLLNEQLATRELDLMDGVKAYDERGWVQVLPDPDEPLVHLYAEGTTEALTDELATEIAALVEGIVQGEASEQRTLEQASS
jgi:mannose-1-phosphate guanylyltransferase/phosphomannomutase